jgi:sulfate adenylyltransferase subunit 2
MDVWQYAKIENIELPNLYFSHSREVVDRNGSLLAVSEFVTPRENENPVKEVVRFRTIGDATCTGAVKSNASSLEEVINEVAASRVTERGSRADDRRSEAAMEDRKKQGYF